MPMKPKRKIAPARKYRRLKRGFALAAAVMLAVPAAVFFHLGVKAALAMSAAALAKFGLLILGFCGLVAVHMAIEFAWKEDGADDRAGE